jgi:hypothetical protein
MDQTATLAVLAAIFANIGAALPALIPVLYTLIAASFVDLISGVWAAWTSGTLAWSFVGEYVRSHIALKIGPIMLTALAGVAVGGADSAGGLALIATAGVSALAYLASTVASVNNNVQEGRTKTKGLPSGVPAHKTP